MNRNLALALAVVAIAVLGVVAWLVFGHVTRLESTIRDLDTTVGALRDDVADAREKATRAEERADRAEEEARGARTEAQQAGKLAEESAERAAGEAEARRRAEEEAEISREASRVEARRAADAEEARKTAEREREAAEQQRLDARLAQLEAEEQARIAAAEAERLRAERERERGRLMDALSRIADTRRTALGVVMNLDERHVEFDFDRAELRARDRELLSRIAGVLLTFEDVSLQVIGHTDDVGSEEYNLELSERRAAAVRDYLVDIGIDEETLSIRGLGESSPLTDGTDDESRQRNRRVELAIALVESTPGPLAEDVSEDPGAGDR